MFREIRLRAAGGLRAVSYRKIESLHNLHAQSLQVLMPSGETVTVARFISPERVLISTAEVTGPVDSDRGCRSQIRTRVSDAEKWLQNFTAELHRVVFYGDHVRDIERMGRLMGFEVVREI